ncbi:MAG: quinone-dependent dihydroorotate dehydrogenase [Pseudomonadota bacterium]|nr:quinone-dependent dihydroorotate dehydrogenase [Pseudomonadota bacterium]
MVTKTQKLLHALPPELAHDVAIAGLQVLGALPGIIRPHESVSRKLFGCEFVNPIGLAAGLDKNAKAVAGLARLVFGFVEVGTVTPRPQPGNPQPRLFRLPEHQALINRMGFNNDGVVAMVRRLDKLRNQNRLEGTIIGVNLGKNKDTPLPEAVDDYIKGMGQLHTLADYFTLNLSSPNTPGLRQLQHGDELSKLLEQVMETQQRLASAGVVTPVLLKVAPDLTDEDIDQIAQQVVRHKLDGLIATNTTLDRRAVQGHPLSEQAGGLSGAPLTEVSCGVVRKFRERLPQGLPIIGVGGIGSIQDAQNMLNAGADLLQIYSSFIYQGSNLVRSLTRSVH